MGEPNRQETDMTGTTRVPRTEITGVYGGLLKVVMRKMLGSVPEGAEVLWNNPRVFKDAMKLGGRVERWDSLDPNLATYATMAAAAEIGCNACLDFGYFKAHNDGLDLDKAQQVPAWRTSDAFTVLERQVMEYAVAMCQTPPAVDDELSNMLLEQLGAEAMVELAARVAFMNMSARMNTSLGIHSDQYADACGLKPLAVVSPA